MDEILIRKTCSGYIRLFPELLDRFIKNNDNSIVELIVSKLQDKSKGIVDLKKLKESVINILKTI